METAELTASVKFAKSFNSAVDGLADLAKDLVINHGMAPVVAERMVKAALREILEDSVVITKRIEHKQQSESNHPNLDSLMTKSKDTPTVR